MDDRTRYNGFEGERIRAYFSHVVSRTGSANDVQVVAVAHMVSNTVHFLPALDSLAEVVLLLPKPSASHSREAALIRQYGFSEGRPTRDWAVEPGGALQLLEMHVDRNRPFVIVDIGGYFAPSLAIIREAYGELFLGVMEGTENGAQKYEAEWLDSFPVAVATVARSPLKLPEDYLVGASIVFSVEALLRSQSQILQTRTACVLGYGRVGSGVAESLRGRGIPTVVHDTSPIKMAEAAARGFQVFRRLDEALNVSTLVVSATGSHALDAIALRSLRNGTLVATVTSADDEFGKDDPLGRYSRSVVGGDGAGELVRYDGDHGRYFWLANDGKPANFAHGAVIGPAIQLIEGEKLMAIRRLAAGEFAVGARQLQEVSDADRAIVAEVWNEHFLDD